MGSRRYTNYNETNICEDCKVEKLRPGNAQREYDENGNFTGRWLCNRCGNRNRQRLPNSTCSKLKSIRNCRTRNIKEIFPEMMKARVFEELICQWRGVKNLNIQNDSYISPIDHSKDLELGIIQTKGGTYRLDGWKLNKLESEWYKPIDHIIYYCADKNFRIIERIYIFPKSEIFGRKGITIVKDPSRGIPWYEKYRTKDEETLQKVNEIFKIILKENKIIDK